MIAVEEALRLISENTFDFGTEEVHLDNSLGRILREDFYADRDFPPYNRVTMDGIAIAHASFASGQRNFNIEGVAAAGSPQQRLSDPTNCLEVMTGAILPAGCDTVIRYEDLAEGDGQVRIQLDSMIHGQNVHNKGEDRAQGSVIVKKGKKISSAEIGVGATIGKVQVKVSSLPKTLIISTGDELVEIQESPLPHQIRRSNIHRLKSTLRNYGIEADSHHFDDDFEEIKNKLQRMIEEYDVILLSGGVSKGKFDYLPEALEAVGVQKLYHKIQQRPGKPMWFGRAPKDTFVFALPGNPVSSFLCMHRYFLTWLRESLQLQAADIPQAALAAPIHFKPNLTYFAQVKLSYTPEGKVLAHPVEGNGSGDLANLVDADAFIQLPQGKDVYEAGEVYALLFYR
ncbi:MAG: molybdopterin molybdotransferase MoeA [Bacteroidia bacterium]|nr:molybdopterin molybdotransferase MoeA [Bacteroidia bacterium]